MQSLGLVTGSTVRAKNIGKGIMAGFKNIVGGELGTYTQLLNEARNQEALQRDDGKTLKQEERMPS